MARRITPRRVRRWLRSTDGFTELLSLTQRDLDTLIWQAQKRLNQGLFDEAAAIYQAILTLWPQDLTALLGLGACLQMKGDFAGAEASYSHVIAIDPTNLFALADRAEVRLLTDRNIEAQADLEVVTALPERQIRLAGLQNRLKQLQEIAANGRTRSVSV